MTVRNRVVMSPMETMYGTPITTWRTSAIIVPKTAIITTANQ